LQNKHWLLMLLMILLLTIIAGNFFPAKKKEEGYSLKLLPYETVISYGEKESSKKVSDDVPYFRFEILEDSLNLYNADNSLYKMINVENIGLYKNTFNDDPYAAFSRTDKYVDLVSKTNNTAILINLCNGEIIVMPFVYSSHLEWNYDDAYCILSKAGEDYLFKPSTQETILLSASGYRTFSFSDTGKYVYEGEHALRLFDLKSLLWKEINVKGEIYALRWADNDESIYIISNYGETSLNPFHMGGTYIKWYVMKVTLKNDKPNIQKRAISMPQNAGNFVWSEDLQSVFYTNVSGAGDSGAEYSGFELAHGFK